MIVALGTRHSHTKKNLSCRPGHRHRVGVVRQQKPNGRCITGGTARCDQLPGHLIPGSILFYGLMNIRQQPVATLSPTPYPQQIRIENSPPIRQPLVFEQAIQQALPALGLGPLLILLNLGECWNTAYDVDGGFAKVSQITQRLALNDHAIFPSLVVCSELTIHHSRAIHSDDHTKARQDHRHDALHVTQTSHKPPLVGEMVRLAPSLATRKRVLLR